jgi:hypothetical protein
MLVIYSFARKGVRAELYSFEVNLDRLSKTSRPDGVATDGDFAILRKPLVRRVAEDMVICGWDATVERRAERPEVDHRSEWILSSRQLGHVVRAFA